MANYFNYKTLVLIMIRTRSFIIVLFFTILFVFDLKPAHATGPLRAFVSPLYDNEPDFVFKPAAVASIIMLPLAAVPATGIGITGAIVGLPFLPFMAKRKYYTTFIFFPAVYTGVFFTWPVSTVVGFPFYVIQKTYYDSQKKLNSAPHIPYDTGRKKSSLKRETEELSQPVLTPKDLKCRLEEKAPENEDRSNCLWIFIENTSDEKTYLIEDVYLYWLGNKFQFIPKDDMALNTIKPREIKYAYIPLQRLNEFASKRREGVDKSVIKDGSISLLHNRYPKEFSLKRLKAYTNGHIVLKNGTIIRTNKY